MRFKVWWALVLPRPSGARLELCSCGSVIYLAIQRATKHSAALQLNCTYEEICLNVHHRSNRRSVDRFLHTTGNYRNFDYGGGNCQSLAHSVAGKEKENRR